MVDEGLTVVMGLIVWDNITAPNEHDYMEPCWIDMSSQGPQGWQIGSKPQRKHSI